MSSTYPAERAVEINATEQQLRSRHSPYTTGAAFAPSEVEEHRLGYDVQIPVGGVEVELQYKSIRSAIDDREFSAGRSYDAYRFPFNPEQAETLIVRAAGVGQTFYALPVVESAAGLPSTLDRTVFVDVAGLASAFFGKGVSHTVSGGGFDQLHAQSQLYVVPKHTDAPAAVYLKERSNSYADPGLYTKISSLHIHTWDEIVGGTLSGAFGTPVVRNGARAPEYERRCRYLPSMNQLVSSDTEYGEAAGAVETYLSERGRQPREYDPLTDDVRHSERRTEVAIEGVDDDRRWYPTPSDDTFGAGEAVLSVCDAVRECASSRQNRTERAEVVGSGPRIVGTDSPLAFSRGQRRVVGL